MLGFFFFFDDMEPPQGRVHLRTYLWAVNPGYATQHARPMYWVIIGIPIAELNS